MVNRSHSPRSVVAGVCGGVGVVLLLLGSALSLGSRAVFNADFFADRVAASLGDPRTAAYVADKLTDAVVGANEDLILVRPLIKTAAQAVVSSEPFQAVAREAVKQSHQLLATRGGQDILLSVSDFGVILKTALAGRPELAAKIPEDAVAVVGGLPQGALLDISREVLHYANRVGTRPRVIFVLGALLLLVGVVAARETERALLRAGVAVTTVAAVTLLTFELGAGIVARLPRDPALGQALAGVWSTFADGFHGRILVLGGIGILMMAAATAFLEMMQLAAIERGVRRVLVEPTDKTWLRVLRGVVLVGAGGLAVLNPTATLRAVVVAVGGLVAFGGLRELCRLAVDPATRLARRTEAAAAAGVAGRDGSRRPLVGLVVMLAAGVGVIFLIRTPPAPAPAAAVDGCNGLPALCAKRLDEVVFACTHNAMGAADVPGWLFPNQQKGVRIQLEDGIRALMLDVLPGIPVGGHVKTDLDEGEISREKLEPALGEEGFAAALRIRERLMGADSENRDLYLCHGLCELGATRFVTVLEEIRDFLLRNPREIIIIIIEDAVPPADIAHAFADSRLIDLVYRGTVTPPWPTLGEMAATGGRVVVLGEQHTEGVPWYHPAWQICQETPYHFGSADEFSCEPNRGGTMGSLLLLNHWITTPPTSLPSDAELVNARDALLARVRECRRVRGRIPNIIAVDFYRTGDLLGVVAELNGAAPAP